MNKLSNGRENMSKEQLMGVCDQLEQELVGAQAVNKAYKKHLEQVIEYHSVEKYRSIVQKNREAAATAPLKFSIEEGYGDKREIIANKAFTKRL